LLIATRPKCFYDDFGVRYQAYFIKPVFIKRLFGASLGSIMCQENFMRFFSSVFLWLLSPCLVLYR